MNLDGSNTIQALSEIILLFFILSFCSLEKRKRKERKKSTERLLSNVLAEQLFAGP
jgi:hypothetical protein